ncbi:MAG: hypothetical protein GX667_10765 [Xanthomonadaceae bacterium]|nr:hypothetical protein [Xanthomonadaceae bacterium]
MALMKVYQARQFAKIGNGNTSIRGSILDRTEHNGNVPLPIHELKIFDQKRNILLATARTDQFGEYTLKSIDPDLVCFNVSHYIDDSKDGEIADNIKPQRDPIYDQIIE